MDDFCGSKFWDLNVTWYTNDPDFTPCFEDTVLVWIPTAFIALFCWFDITSALRSKGKPLPTSILYIVHNVVMILLIAAQVADFAYTFKSGGPEIFPADRAAPACRVVSYILAAITHGINKRKGIPSSGTLFMFWFSATICGVFEFQTWIRALPLGDDSYAKFWFGTAVVTYVLTVIECGLHFFSDNASIQKTAGVDESSDDVTTRSSRKLPKLEPCPAPWASFPSKITYQWFWGVAWKGFRKPLEYDELWDLNTTEKSKTVLKLFYEYWRPALEDAQRWNSQNEIKVIPSSKSQEKQVKDGKEPKSNRKTASVLPAVWRTIWSTFLFGASLKVVQDLLTFVSPQLLNVLIQHVQSDEEEWKGYFYAALLFLAVMVQTFFLSSYFYYMFMVGMRVRSALIGAIYDKSLVISNSARRAFTVGEIVNLMSVDAQRFVDITTYVNMIWSAPLQITLSVYFLYNTLGPSVFAGVGVLLLLIPVSGFMANKMKALQFAQLQQKDKRVKLMNEVLSGIKVLKLYAWELSFQGQVNAIREREIQLLRRAAIWQALSMFVYYTTPFLVSLVTLGTYVLIDDQNVLDANKAFVSLTLFNVMRMPMTMLPMIIVFMIEANVSLKRINKFMNADEIDKTAITHVKDGENIVTVKNGNFSWGETPVLKDINFEVKKGSLTAVVGTVGSGKSSLLSALLGEMEKVNGQVNRLGSVAYVAQQAWIQNATLRENILFEKDYNEKMYRKVIKDCALEPDLKILTAGDRTEIGEKGINLSGGQKQRVSLARAVYNNADLYLLDDPLSAVDSHVGKHLFDKVIGPKGILKHKTRLIVTHGITYLPHVDNIIVMKDGQIEETGTFQQLLDKKGSFSEFLELHATQEDLENVDEETAEKLQQVLNRSNSVISTGHQDRRNSSWSLRSRASVRSKSSVGSNTDQESTTTETGEKLIEIEKAETGSVKSDVYWYYLRFLGHGYVILSLVFNIAIQLFMALSNVWLSRWSNEEPNADGTQDADTRNKYLGVYGAFGLGQAVSIVIASIAMSYGTLRAGKLMQSRMLARVLRSPMSFFDTTPLGRIVNRFAKDVDVADATFPQNLKSWLNCLFQVLSTLVIISVSTPWFLVVIIPIAIIYYATQRFYVATSRQLKRIESITRSPIYSHFSETLTGAVTIRAFGMGRTFAVDSALKVDVNQIAYFPSIIANRWLAIRLETVGNFIIFFAALFAVLSNNDKGSLGLSVSYALSITQTLNWLVRMTSDVETNIVAIERIKEYTEVPQEADWNNETKQPPKEWPHAGNIEFVQYQTRYREGLDLVLKDVTCQINSGEKIGIVGRTGAGKSSLTVGLFRLIEAAGGKIVIDGVDISEIGLHDVRGKLTIIPQDPVLFSGTLRINLDPFGDKSDDELWNALEYAHLKEFVKTLPEGLEYNIAEGGDNLSVGQRQLVCLARALLRKTKVLILDEATAAVDLDTDDLIQKTIRSEFKDCTVLTIAHRLNTIMDYNRVMVLDKGIIKEFDSPDILLKDNESIFYGMAKDANLV